MCLNIYNHRDLYDKTDRSLEMISAPPFNRLIDSREGWKKKKEL